MREVEGRQMLGRGHTTTTLLFRFNYSTGLGESQSSESGLMSVPAAPGHSTPQYARLPYHLSSPTTNTIQHTRGHGVSMYYRTTSQPDHSGAETLIPMQTPSLHPRKCPVASSHSLFLSPMHFFTNPSPSRATNTTPHTHHLGSPVPFRTHRRVGLPVECFVCLFYEVARFSRSKRVTIRTSGRPSGDARRVFSGLSRSADIVPGGELLSYSLDSYGGCRRDISRG